MLTTDYPAALTIEDIWLAELVHWRSATGVLVYVIAALLVEEVGLAELVKRRNGGVATMILHAVTAVFMENVRLAELIHRQDVIAARKGEWRGRQSHQQGEQASLNHWVSPIDRLADSGNCQALNVQTCRVHWRPASVDTVENGLSL